LKHIKVHHEIIARGIEQRNKIIYALFGGKKEFKWEK